MTAPLRTFRPDVCCDHEWHLDQYTGVDSHGTCSKCGATCKRDAAGAIVEYDAFPLLAAEYRDGL